MRSALLNIAVNAARAAGTIIMRSLDRMDKVDIKTKKTNDFVTEVDQKAEREIVEIIRKAHPSHGFLCEEGGEIPGKNEEYVWIIDPLDGTRNFIHGLPHFAVSIAFTYKGKIEHGVIYDPVRQDLFVGSRGKGAFLNDHRIRVSKRAKLEEALLGTGFPYSHTKKQNKDYIDTLQSLFPLCSDIRRAGAATLDLAYVAAGRLDGFWETGLKPWDLAAGTLLVKEAGGLVTDLHGGEGYMESGDVVVGNPKLLKLLLKAINRPE